MALIVVSDTGPLLCTGMAGSTIIKQVAALTSGRLVVPAAVRAELARLVKEGKQSSVRDAAARVIAAADDLFTVSGVVLDGARVRGVRAEVDAQDRRKRGIGVPTARDVNLGESQAIVLAEAEKAILLTNDMSAMVVGEQHSLPVGTFVTVLRAEVRCGRLDSAKGAELAERLRRGSCFPGQKNVKAVTLATGYIPDGFLP